MMGPKSKYWYLYKKRSGHTDTQRHQEEVNVTTEAEIGVMHFQGQGMPRIVRNQQKLGERHRSSRFSLNRLQQ